MLNTPRYSRQSESSQYDEAAIYYEPDQTHYLKTTYFNDQHPFYIKNPTSKTPILHEIGDRLEVTETQPSTTINNNIISSQENHRYLDLSIEDSVKPRYTNELHHIALSEKTLLECLDLHFVVYSRKSGNRTIPSQVVQPEILERSKIMSDTELIMAIERKCSQPIQIVNRSLKKIQESQPKKIKYASQAFNEISDSSLESYENSSSRETNTSFYNDYTYGEQKSNLTNHTPHITVESMDSHRSNKARMENSNNEYKHETSESKLVSTRSTIGSPNIRISDDSVAYYSTEDIAQVNYNNSFASLYNETIEDENSALNENNTFLLPKNLSIDIESTTTADILMDDYASDASRQTDTSSTESTITADETTMSPENKYSYTTSLETLTTTLPTTHDVAPQLFYKANGNTFEENYHLHQNAASETIKDQAIRQRYKEGEVFIPKILTKELTNGNVVSTVEGYEILPNGDFQVNIDLPDEASTSAKKELDSRRGFHATNHLPPEHSEISGKIYLMFDQALIPTRFVQHPDGFVSLGLDGNTMCDNFLKKHGHGSHFLSKLCRAVIRDQFEDRIPLEKN